MRKVCSQAVEKLGIVLCQTAVLYTRRTQETGSFLQSVGLYTKDRTGFAQFFSAFTQAKNSIFNLFYGFLYPVSTVPINNTNLIKE